METKDVNKLNKKLQRLEKQVILLKESNERKSNYVSKVSHELRNPLVTVKEAIELLLDGTMGELSEGQALVLQAGKRNVERLVRLVSTLLDLAKIESGKMQCRHEDVSVLEIIADISLQYQSRLMSKQLQLKKIINIQNEIIWTDKDKLIQIIFNLVDNAIKYTKGPGEITIQVDQNTSTGAITFKVSDTGEGISADNLSRLFEKFRRVTKQNVMGTGLGLSITKALVEFLGGSMTVESELGKGSVFSFTITSLKEQSISK